MLTYFGKGPGGPGLTTDGLGTIQAVRGYWEALRKAGGIPRRDQIDPRGLAQSLDKVFLIERIAKGHARLRLAGMHLNDLIGMDMRGMPLTSFFDHASRAKLVDELEQVFAAPSILEIWLEAERGTSRPSLSGRMVLMPLLGSEGEPGLALGVLITDGPIGRQPRRFAITGMVQELIALPKLQPVPAARSMAAVPKPAPKPIDRPVLVRPAKLPMPEMAQPLSQATEAMLHPPRRPLGKPNLRLVSSRD